MSEYRNSDGFQKTYTTKDAVISSGQSLSAAIDLEQLNITGFQMPSSWTAAKLTFQVSADGVTYADAVDASGNELQVTVSASKFVGVDLPELSGIRFLKVRSGISGTPVSQAADRTISIVLTTNAEASAAGTASQTAATVPSATTMQNAAAANGNGTNLNVQGFATAIINITSSPSMSGGTVVNFEASTDDTEWQPILAHQIGVQGNQVLTTSTDGDYRINCAGFKSIRTRISGYSAGAVTTKGYATPLSGPATTVGISGANHTAQTDATQTTSIGSFIKGLVKILADVWDSTNHWLKVVVLRQQTVLSATISNGTALSAEIDLSGYSVVAIYMPSAWTAANLTFQAVDVSGGTYEDVYDAAGNELSVIAAASRVLTDIPELAPIRFLKVRSGTSGTPVNQGADRTIKLVLKG